ncbi:MAG: HAMP domain-containing histidine kinase [Phycisphaerales bacterium]|nr:HAMP domain-containing histidine kinase [Phycisphaerales bacterium]
MRSGLSLANKCQLLFGAAIVVIIAAALVVPWFRLGSVADHTQLETSRQLARLWGVSPPAELAGEGDFEPGATPMRARYFTPERWRDAAFDGKGEDFERAARKALETETEVFEALWADRGVRVYRYAAIVKPSPAAANPATEPGAGGDAGADAAARPPAGGVLVIERGQPTASSVLFLDRVFLFGAGALAGLLAIALFHVLTKRIILSPVRSLRDTAELVRAGNLNTRSAIRTGDEFQDLSDAFNSMLGVLADQQSQLRGINRSLDLKINELHERNVALHEAARLKGEFLANISHELRTPLNSIIGFAEILQDILRAEDHPPDDPHAAKRRRYLENIVSAGRNLLEMINELLMMARIEAGNVEIHVGPMNVAETCEGLLALIRPLADRKRLSLRLELQGSGRGGFTADPRLAEMPVIETDAKKLQQVVFNFLSNAVKFTPEEGEVTLRAERLLAGDGSTRVRISVLDTGPGIPRDQHAIIFEKFTQLESGHTRKHDGTGLGLAIAKEFAEMLGGEILLESEPGAGSMFSVVVPVKIEPRAKVEPRTLGMGAGARSARQRGRSVFR